MHCGNIEMFVCTIWLDKGTGNDNDNCCIIRINPMNLLPAAVTSLGEKWITMEAVCGVAFNQLYNVSFAI